MSVQLVEQIEAKAMEELKCARCNNFPTQYVYTCAENHRVCHSCSGSRCPGCEDKQPVRRNPALTAVLTALTKKCIHSGCAELLVKPKWLVHIKTCAFMQPCHVKVPAGATPDKGWTKCPWRGQLVQLESHVQQAHRYNWKRLEVGDKYTVDVQGRRDAQTMSFLEHQDAYDLVHAAGGPTFWCVLQVTRERQVFAVRRVDELDESVSVDCELSLTANVCVATSVVCRRALYGLEEILTPVFDALFVVKADVEMQKLTVSLRVIDDNQ